MEAAAVPGFCGGGRICRDLPAFVVAGEENWAEKGGRELTRRGFLGDSPGSPLESDLPRD